MAADATPDGTRGIALAALGANVVRAGLTFAGHIATGSSAMLAAAIHALADVSSQLLLVFGLTRAKGSATTGRPAGATGELTFWSSVAAMLMYALGAGIAIYEGVMSLVGPRPVERPDTALVALGASAAIMAAVAWRTASEVRLRAPEDGFLATVRSMRNPALFALFVESRSALAGLVVALAGILTSSRLALPGADGAASILVGLVMAATAAILALEVRALIVANAAPASADTSRPAVVPVEGTQLGPAGAPATASTASPRTLTQATRSAGAGEPEDAARIGPVSVDAPQPMSRKARKKAKRHRH